MGSCRSHSASVASAGAHESDTLSLRHLERVDIHDTVVTAWVIDSPVVEVTRGDVTVRYTASCIRGDAAAHTAVAVIDSLQLEGVTKSHFTSSTVSRSDVECVAKSLWLNLLLCVIPAVAVAVVLFKAHHARRRNVGDDA